MNKNTSNIKYFFNILLITILIFNFNFIAFSQNSGIKPYHDNILIVKLKSDEKKTFTNQDLNNLVLPYFQNKSYFKIEQEFPNSKKLNNKDIDKNVDLSNIYRITYLDKNIDPAILANKMSKSNIFEYAEPLYKIELLYVPNDPLNQENQYWLEKVKAYEAWDIHKGDTNTVIGISDTGIEVSHPDLINQIKYNYADPLDGIDNDLDGYIDNFRGWNFAENNNIVSADVHQHGTWVAGIAGAENDNGIGVSGAGYKCKVLPLKIMNPDGIIENAYQSIVYAAEHNVDVINCSWGSTHYQKMGQDVVNYATNNFDLLIVAASGNTNSDLRFYPASYDNVLSVAGTQEDDERWTPENSIAQQGTTYSYTVDLCAPATNFLSTGAIDSYTLMYGGTSFAAPIVAGFAGILRSYHQEFTAKQIMALIKAGCDNIDTIEYNIPFAGKLGKGRLNMYKSLSMEIPPAVVLEDISVNDNNNTISIGGSFINYLKSVENLTITAEVVNEYANIINPTIFEGSLEQMQSYSSASLILIELDENIPYDYNLAIKLNYSAENYTDYQFIDFLVNPSYIDINTEKLSLSITANGRIGYSDSQSSIGNGLNYNNLYDLFYDCGIISGNSAVNLFSSIRQNSDFKNEKYPEIITDEIADQHIKLEFSDSLDLNAKGIYIIENAYSWTENENFVIIDYDIINTSDYPIENYYFGLFTDWDLIEAAKNSAIFDQEAQMLYAKSNSEQSMNAGIKLLSKQTPIYYALDQADENNEVININDGFSDIEKFYMISNPNFLDSNLQTDIVLYTGVGPVNILAKDTITVGFAIIADPNLYKFKQAITNANEKYNEVLYPQNVEDDFYNEFSVFPNPCSNKLNINTNSSENFEVIIYNSLGKEIQKFNSNFNTNIDLTDYESGIYLLKIKQGDKEFLNKISVIK
ncbi:MAG TPA: S8/S53 family peptidase [Bacteroidales bacterium]|nr:S8/S53 family peptidase [Bacteroidales bacterium]HOR60572.1 S8/S53 family peptidase [Bacteroidales bacterium]HPL05291.1 S8/S53 family peptidase [Bacteroidales bacterium]